MMNQKNGRVTIFVSALLLLTIILVAANTLVVNNVSAQVSPTLGAASSYSLFGGSGVSCSGGASVTGDVGISPGPATAITGFPGLCSIVPPGANQGGPPGTNAARAAIGAAFTALTQTCTGNGGTPYPDGTNLALISPLPPGVYCSAGSFSLSGTLILSGSGVWIFRTVSTLLFNPGAKIVGGDPCNVWWQVGKAATLDTTNPIIGNILAVSGIQLNGGSILNGRALA